MVRQRHHLIPSRDIDDKRTMEFDWIGGKPWPYPTKIGNLT